MVTFLTVFLSLVSGVKTVELAVEQPAARVELLLDGTVVAVMTQPPWMVSCDFGEELRPHLLEAVTRDAAGQELGRTSQAVNIPRPPAEAEIVLERDDVGLPVAARVVAKTVDLAAPRSVSVRLDGAPLTADQRGRFPLPPCDPKEVHVLGATVTFPGRLATSAQVTFGGAYGNEVMTDLTAVPVVGAAGTTPSVAALQGAFRAAGKDLPVAAVEALGARILVVQDVSANVYLRRLVRMVDASGAQGFPRSPHSGAHDDPGAELFELVVPHPESTAAGGEQVSLFPRLGPLSLADRSLQWLVTRARSENRPTAGQRLADAVAAAGLTAAGTAARRAVVLVLGNQPVDESQWSPAQVESYLERIHVPLVVWSVAADPADHGWSGVVDASAPADFIAAAREVTGAVRRQWIVWLEGSLLPDRIEIVREGIHFAGRS